MQTVHTKHFGDVVFKRTWRTPSSHIGLRANGVYTHFNGLPITNPDILRETISDPDDLELALDWWQRELDPESVKPRVRKVYYESDDKTYRFLDTHQIVDTRDALMAALRDETQEAALLWFARYHAKARRGEMTDQPTQAKMLDEQIIDLLAVEPGLTVHALQQTLEAQAAVMVETLKLLQDRNQVVRQGKVYYLSSHMDVSP